MCGRFTLETPIQEVARLFQADEPGDVDLPPRYNIAPTQPVLVVRPKVRNGGRELAVLRWGLVPGWVKDPGNWPTLINARAESLDHKPAFKSALQFRRCLIPADGFFEWRRERDGKQPYFIHSVDRSPLAFGGLWEEWGGGGQEPVQSCTIVTTEANTLVRPLHDRMPLILDGEAQEAWLDASTHTYGRLKALLRPPPPEGLAAYPVSRAVNRPEADGPDCIQPLEAAPGPPQLDLL